MDTERLQHAEYAAIVEQAPILIWRAGADALCNYFNERWLRFRGRTMEEEAGNGWTEGVHPDDFDECVQCYLKNFRERLTFEMEYRLMRHDGVYRWIFDRGVPFYAPNGDFSGYIGSCTDVTERVEAQEELRRRTEHEIHQLRGFLPICCHCKKIRNDNGYWQQVEVYIHEHSEAQFSHGICPDCMKMLYPTADITARYSEPDAKRE